MENEMRNVSDARTDTSNDRKETKKTVFSYIFAYLSFILASVCFAFVGFENTTGGFNEYNYTPVNTFIYEVLPLILGIALMVAYGILYYKNLPLKKNNLFLIGEVLMLGADAFAIWFSFFLWDTCHFYGSIIYIVVAFLLTLGALFTILLHFLPIGKKKE